MRVRGVVSAARASGKSLTAGMIRDHVRATKRAAEELKGFLKEGSAVTAVGISPERVGFDLEAAGRVVA
jgi:hypothetical protein